jgi:predicted protein tyrosine phosphatase
MTSAVRYASRMHLVHDGLYIGSETDCRHSDDKLAVVHGCKDPCHRRAVGYSGNLSPSHPNYLVLERGDDLFLSLIDPPGPLFKLESFTAYLAFARRQVEEGRDILVHCNMGQSRAPSLAMLALAKVRGAIPDGSFDEAMESFLALWPSYHPGTGISRYLERHWVEIE